MLLNKLIKCLWVVATLDTVKMTAGQPINYLDYVSSGAIVRRYPGCDYSSPSYTDLDLALFSYAYDG